MPTEPALPIRVFCKCSRQKVPTYHEAFPMFDRFWHFLKHLIHLQNILVIYNPRECRTVVKINSVACMGQSVFSVRGFLHEILVPLTLSISDTTVWKKRSPNRLVRIYFTNWQSYVNKKLSQPPTSVGC